MSLQDALALAIVGAAAAYLCRAGWMQLSSYRRRLADEGPKPVVVELELPKSD